ncbi:hypothetical protein KSC_027180 [Ktedonobacter sp. SOSP1-52]|nr:hypothetical protein KSC_027180 [Ktedonobacter sp. SOSP1-52]
MDSNCAQKSIEIGVHGSNDLDYFGIVACRLFPGGIPVTAGKTSSMIDTKSPQALMYLAHRYVRRKEGPADIVNLVT